MPRISVVAKNYAKALFAAACKNSLNEVEKDLENFRKNFSLDFARELKNPVISGSDAVKIITQISTNLKLGKLLSEFLKAVTRNKRLNLFPEIYEEFTRLAKLKNNILEVELILSHNKDQIELETIKSVISKKYSSKKVEYKETIRKDILGGIQVKIGSNLIDASLKNQLVNLEKELIKAIK